MLNVYIISLAISSDTFSPTDPVKQDMKILAVPYKTFNKA